MPQKLSALPIQAKVKDTTSLYYGKPIVYKVVAKNHTGFPASSVTVIADKILCLKAFDAKEASNSDANRQNYGNNRYLYANLRRWLNSEAAAWYAAQHGADAPPNASNVSGGYNPYESEPGFMAGLSAAFKAAILSTARTVVKNTVADGGGTETVTDKFFLASVTEVGLANEGVAEGTLLAGFSDNASRIAYPTAEAVANSNYTNSSINTGAGWYYWLSTPYAASSYYVRTVYSDGALSYALAYGGYGGVRPLCNLNSEILVSDTADSDGAYTIVWNQPPTNPEGINLPSTIIGGKPAAITWGASTDTDGSIGGYILERATNGGAFSQIYKGTSRAYSDSIIFGWTMVQYRVKAYDNNAAESGYTATAALNVVNSKDPVINGTDSDLGLKTAAFNQTYSVTNPDAPTIAKTLTVVERIDGKQKRSFTATSGSGNTCVVTAEEWTGLANGSHTLTVTVTDNYGGTATRTFTFSKSVTEIEFTLSTPLPADAAVTKAIMNVARQIPPGAEFSVEVCNNAFDASPAWQDVTNAVLSGSKIFLENTTKTATNWGFNIRMKVNRKTAKGDCYISGMGGNFE